jgi:hypothetical protein
VTAPKPPPPALRELREAIEAYAEIRPLPNGADWYDVLVLLIDVSAALDGWPPPLSDLREAIEAAAQGEPLPRGQDWYDVLLLVAAVEKHLNEPEAP